MPENPSLPRLTMGSFQLQPPLKWYVALLVRTNPGCSRSALAFQSFWPHKPLGPQSGFLARKCSSLSCPENKCRLATLLAHPFHSGGDIQFETPTIYTLLRTPAFCDHNACHFYSGVWIGSRGGVDRVSVASLALERCARIRTEMTLLHMQVSMGELRLRLLSLRFDLLLCCTYHATYVTVNNLLLNSFSTKRKARLYKKRRYVDLRQDMW